MAITAPTIRPPTSPRIPLRRSDEDFWVASDAPPNPPTRFGFPAVEVTSSSWVARTARSVRSWASSPRNSAAALALNDELASLLSASLMLVAVSRN